MGFLVFFPSSPALVAGKLPELSTISLTQVSVPNEGSTWFMLVHEGVQKINPDFSPSTYGWGFLQVWVCPKTLNTRRSTRFRACAFPRGNDQRNHPWCLNPDFVFSSGYPLEKKSRRTCYPPAVEGYRQLRISSRRWTHPRLLTNDKNWCVDIKGYHSRCW